MSAEENKAIVRQVYEVFSSGNLDDLDQLLATDIVDHNPVPGQLPGLAGVKQVMHEFQATFPDLQIMAEDMLAEGDKVAARITQRGTHQGTFMGMPPTGKQVTVSGMDLVRLVDGKVAERWGNGDDLGMLQQLGLMPAPGQATQEAGA